MKKIFIITFVLILLLSGCGKSKSSLAPIKNITLSNSSDVSESAKEAYSDLTNGNALLPTDYVIIETTMGDYKINEVLEEQYPNLKLPSQDYTDIANGKSNVWIFVAYNRKGKEKILIKNGKNVKILPVRNNTFKKVAIAYDKCKDSTVIIKKVKEYFEKYYKNADITGIELVASGYVNSDFPFPLYGFRYSTTKPQGTIFFGANNGVFVLASGIWTKVTKP